MKVVFKLIGLAIICSALCVLSGTARSLAGEELQENSDPATAGSDAPANKLKIFVSILPLQDFVEKVGGDLVEVEVLVPPGQSPATYTVTAKQMARLVKADLLFTCGLPFEDALLPKIKRLVKSQKVVNTAQYIRPYKINGTFFMPVKDEPDSKAETGQTAEGDSNTRPQDEAASAVAVAVDQAVEPEDEGHFEQEEHGEHYSMEDRDPHTWLSPLLAKAQVYTISQNLCKIDPDNAETYKANQAAFEKELTKLHHRLYRELRPMRHKMFIVFHPAFGYFARAYGLWQLIIEEDGKPPSAKRLAELIALAKEKEAKVIFVQKQFDHRAAQTIADEIGGSLIEVDPLAKDYIKNMTEMGDQIAAVLQAQEAALQETAPQEAEATPAATP
ncbi:MAG: zinc ABC transporter substrate-binding protein [Planctomycetes bacterium]|nr:zinc ABC transporter substrate-binding protein [Planctomycetota bacterium]